MLIPNPILLAAGPSGRVVVPITAVRGGLAGYILLSQSGPVTVELSTDGGITWTVVTYPVQLAAGDHLGLTRTDSSGTTAVVAALAPVDEDAAPDLGGGPFWQALTEYQRLPQSDGTTIISYEIPEGLNDTWESGGLRARYGDGTTQELPGYGGSLAYPEALPLNHSGSTYADVGQGNGYALIVRLSDDTLPDLAAVEILHTPY